MANFVVIFTQDHPDYKRPQHVTHLIYSGNDIQCLIKDTTKYINSYLLELFNCYPADMKTTLEVLKEQIKTIKTIDQLLIFIVTIEKDLYRYYTEIAYRDIYYDNAGTFNVFKWDVDKQQLVLINLNKNFPHMN